jgi:hypothetical protein
VFDPPGANLLRDAPRPDLPGQPSRAGVVKVAAPPRPRQRVALTAPSTAAHPLRSPPRRNPQPPRTTTAPDVGAAPPPL